MNLEAGINVLSLFDGHGCGMIALIEEGIKVNKYYASEVDKYAIAQTKLNFPNNIHLGDVRNVDVNTLEHIDLVIGGSPCQSFSFAGKRKGMATKCEVEIYSLEKYLELKEQGFEFEGQSYLFWEYMRILSDVRKYNPDVKFLLENVEMGNKWERILSEAIGVFGVHINSALVSAQNRKRIYWTNIRTRQQGLFGELHSDIPQPKYRGILLKDILESEVDEKYYIKSESIAALVKYNERQVENNRGFSAKFRDTDTTEKMDCLKIGGGGKDDLICVAMRCRESAVLSPKHTEYGKQIPVEMMSRIRRLTPTECARLQTVPEWYKWECSDTQQYKMLGNGWTVAVIKHIFSFLK